MKLIDELRGSRRSPATAHLLFLQNQKYGGVHAFMEGNSDPAFYRTAILRFYSDFESVFVYDCGGKKGVYEIRTMITMRNLTGVVLNVKIITMYFVDKDLSDIVPETCETGNDIYVTDHYSIENYLVSKFMFDTIIDDCFNITKGGALPKSELTALFEQQLLQFYELVAPIMAWGVYLRRKNVKFDFSDIKLGRLLEFKENLTIMTTAEMDAKGHVSILEECCQVQTPPEYTTEAPRLIAELKRYQPKQYVRGKFEIWFMLKFADAVRKQLKKSPGVEFRYSDALMSEKDIVKFLGPRMMPLPPSLTQFLAKNIIQSFS